MAIFVKKTLPGFVFLGIGIALILGLLFKINPSQIWSSILRFNFLEFLVIITLTFLGIFIGIWRGQLILRSQGIKMPFWKLFFVGMAGLAFSYLTPLVYVGGEGVKGYLLNQQFNVPWRKAAVFLAIDKLFEITAAFFVVFAGVIVLIFYLGFSGLTQAMLTIVGSVGALSFMFILFYLVLFQKKKVFTSVLKFFRLEKTRLALVVMGAEDDILSFFDPTSSDMWKAWFLSLLRQLFQITRHVLIIYFLGRGLQIGASLMSLSILYLGYAVPIPAALGVQEAFQSILFALFGWGAGEGLALSLILRASDIFVVGIGVTVLLKYGIKFMTRTATYLMDAVKSENSHNT